MRKTNHLIPDSKESKSSQKQKISRYCVGRAPDSSRMEERIQVLEKQVSEKDALISTLKEKTKAYIQKLQQEHSEALQTEKSLTKQAQVRMEMLIITYDLMMHRIKLSLRSVI